MLARRAVQADGDGVAHAFNEVRLHDAAGLPPCCGEIFGISRMDPIIGQAVPEA